MDLFVDIAGVAGFVLSLILAGIQILGNRLRIRTDECTLIEFKNSTYLFVYITNRTRIPFTLINASLKLEKKGKNIEFEKTVRTFRQFASGDRAEVKPVVLSQGFPVQFGSYASQPFLLEVLNQHIDKKFLLPGVPDHSPKGLLPKLLRHIRTSCIPQHLPALMLNTSRGHRAVAFHVGSVQEWAWLRDYAVRKAACEEKLIFPK